MELASLRVAQVSAQQVREETMKTNLLKSWVTRWFAIGLWPVLAGAQTNYIPLASFGTADFPGSHCVAELYEGSDGALYGTITEGTGGAYGGTVFKINKNGSGARTLHVFGTGVADGGTPEGGLVELSGGALYGTTMYGGAASGLGFGTLFTLAKNGSGYAVLHRFGLNGSDGKYPDGTLAVAEGILYGTTGGGGSLNCGTIFKITENGTGYSVVYSFKGGGTDLATPVQGVVLGSDGALYGKTAYGSNSSAGAIFKINPDGSGYAVLRNFAETGGDAAAPCGLIEGNDGVLYGVSYSGGASEYYGTVFKLGKDGSGYRLLHSFAHNGRDGFSSSTLVEGRDGALYGTTDGGGLYEGGTAYKLNKDGSGYTILRNFRNGSEAGWSPEAGLVQGSDGAFYGTTYYSLGDGLGPGVVFALFPQPRSWFTAWTPGVNGLSSLEAVGAADTRFRLQAGAGVPPSNYWDVATNSASALGTLSFRNLPTNQPQLFFRLVAP